MLHAFFVLTKRLQKPNALLLTILTLLSGCAPKSNEGPPKLASINLIDRDGMSETISNPERLEKFSSIDFHGNQPYQKVLRVYERDENNIVGAHVTSYHPNGQIKQYLEVLNGRAFGTYCEWYSTGVKKVEAHVIGGQPDITPNAEKTWLFEGTAKAWDEAGNLIAEIPYSKGALQGMALYYHPNGKLWKKAAFNQNELHGPLEIYTNSGMLLQTMNYSVGQKDGLACRYWEPEKIASHEIYSEGRLITGLYYKNSGELISTIDDGIGFRAVFGKDGIAELQEYRCGFMQGQVKVFNRANRLMRLYFVKNGLKHGEETEYYDFLKDGKPQPKLTIPWFEGKIQGVARTWYDNGILESQRELSNNNKMGVASAWYRDGNLMLLEEYDNNKLDRGEYYRIGEKVPISTVSSGKGTATLFDSEGHFLRRVIYNNGTPNE